MTLITAIVLGLALGWIFGFTNRALVVFLPIWLVVLVLQTMFVVARARIPPKDWGYVPVQFAILAIAALMIWLGAKVRSRYSPPATST